MIEQLTAIVGLVSGLAGAVPPVASVLGSWVRKLPNSTPAGVHLVSLETTTPAQPAPNEITAYMRSGAVVGAIGAVYLTYGALVVTSTIDFGSADWLEFLIGALLMLEGFYFGFRASLRRHMTKCSGYPPAHMTQAALAFSGDRDVLAGKSIQAMLAIGAIRATGSFAREVDRRFEIQGGTGRWPRRFDGERITVSLTETPEGIQIEIQSESIWPEAFMRYNNERNVRRLVESIVG